MTDIQAIKMLADELAAIAPQTPQPMLAINASAAILALLAEVERLTAENARLQADLNAVPREAIATEHNHFYPATKLQEWKYEAVHHWLYPETLTTLAEKYPEEYGLEKEVQG